MSDRQALIARLRNEASLEINRDDPLAKDILALLTALEEAQGVPREPTDAMLEAGWKYVGIDGDTSLIDVWQAMYDAAPAAPTTPTTTEFLTDPKLGVAASTREPDEQDARRLLHELVAAYDEDWGYGKLYAAHPADEYHHRKRRLAAATQAARAYLGDAP